eukprot:m.131580 g.131580  ORF g.131580 m.131580 type:complete len:55 (-) comp9814_c0_seq2:185-349(-)
MILPTTTMFVFVLLSQNALHYCYCSFAAAVSVVRHLFQVCLPVCVFLSIHFVFL